MRACNMGVLFSVVAVVFKGVPGVRANRVGKRVGD